MTLASALSNSVSLEEPESDLRREGSGGLSKDEGVPLVELILDEELCCVEPVTGFEAVEFGPHDGEQKVDDGDAVVGPVLDYVCEVHGLLAVCD